MDNIDQNLYSSSIVKLLISYVNTKYPAVNTDAILDSAGISSIELNDPGCWFNQELCDRLYEELVVVTNNPNLARETGRYISTDKGIGAIRQYVLGLISPRRIYKSMDRLYATVSRAMTVRTRAIGDNQIEIVARPKPGVKEKPYQCAYRLGSFESIMKPFVGKTAEVEHPECLHRGADECRYIVRLEITRYELWKRIRNLTALLTLAGVWAGSFFVSTQGFLVLLIGGLTTVGLITKISDHILHDELRRLIENQAVMAKDLIGETNNRYTYSLVTQHVGQATLSLFNEDAIYQKVLDIVSEHLPFAKGCFFSVDQDKKPVFRTFHGYRKADQKHLSVSLNQLVGSQPGFYQNLMDKNQPVVLGHFLESTVADDTRKKSLVLVPVQYENHPLGILGLEMDSDGLDIRKSDLNLLMGIAAQVSLSIMNARSYEKLKESEKQLQHAVKMESLGTMASGISHEFNNILASILLNAEFALEGVNNRQITSHSLDQILKAGNYAKKLIQQILTYSRKSDHEKEVLNIGEVINESIEMLRSMLPATVRIQRSLSADALYVYADRIQIQQIMLNLGHNAADAMNHSGIMEIKLLPVEESAETPAQNPGRFVKLTFQDTGMGIPSESLDRIFDPFYTTKGADAGTGLGLSVVYGIVKSHQGRIQVQSEVGKGARFTIHFPLREDFLRKSVTKKSVPVQKGSESILLVDDEELIVDVIQRYLQKQGYRITTAKNGEEGLYAFQQRPNHFDLVITDMNMAHVDGYSLFQRIRQIREDIPVILCSGHSDLHTVKNMHTDISDFLFKPVSMKDLSASIRNALSH